MKHGTFEGFVYWLIINAENPYLKYDKYYSQINPIGTELLKNPDTSINGTINTGVRAIANSMSVNMVDINIP